MSDEHDRIEVLGFWLKEVGWQRSEIRQDGRIHKAQRGYQNVSVFVFILVPGTAEDGRPRVTYLMERGNLWSATKGYLV